MSGLNFERTVLPSVVKEPRPGDSEVTYPVFESSCHLLLPI